MFLHTILQVIFEGNCLQVTEAANRISPPDNELYTIMQDIQIFLKLSPNWKITFAYRDANRIAHLLAKHACN